MTTTTEGIVLRSWKYKENDCIVQIYTRELGRQSYLIHAPQSKRSKFRAAYLTPLTCLDLEVSHSPKRDLGSIEDARAKTLHLSLTSHPIKSSLAFFLADVVAATQMQGERDDVLFDYLREVIAQLDVTDDGLGDFHIRFLADYALLMGFEPEWNVENEYYLHLNQQDRDIFQQGWQSKPLTRSQRRRWVDLQLAYLRYHLPHMGQLVSLDVLNGLFD